MDGRIADDTMLSFVCPIHNAEGQLELFHEQLKQVADDLGSGYEIIFVNDGSTDESLSVLRSLAKRDGAVRYLDLSRQFGLPAALVAGCNHAVGQATVAIGVEQSPDRVTTLLQRWQGGWEIVHGTAGSKDNPIGLRLLDHKATQALCQWYDPGRSIDQVLSEIGFHQGTIPYPADGATSGSRRTTNAGPRQAGWERLLLRPAALSRWLGGIGIVLIAAAIVYLGAGGVLALTGVRAFSTALTAGLLIAGGQTLCLAGILECLRKTGSRVDRRPSYVIRHRHGFGDNKPETPERPETQSGIAARFTVLT